MFTFIFVRTRRQTINPQSRQSARLFLQSSELRPPPSPHPQASVCPPFGSGGGHTRLRERVSAGWYSRYRYICTLCINPFISIKINDLIQYMYPHWVKLI